MKLVLRPLTKCILHVLLLVQIPINIEVAMLVTVWAKVHAVNQKLHITSAHAVTSEVYAINQKTAVDSQSCARKDN